MSKLYVSMHFKIHQVIKIPPEKEDSLEVNETTTIYPDLSDEENLKNTKESTFSNVFQNSPQSDSGLCPIDAENCFFERFRKGNKQNSSFPLPKLSGCFPQPSWVDSEVKESWFKQPSVKTSSSTSYLNIQDSIYTTPSQHTVNKNYQELLEERQGSTELSDRKGSDPKSCLNKSVRPSTSKKIYKNHLRFEKPSSQSFENSSLNSKCKSLTDLQDLDKIRKIKNCYIQNYNDILAVLFETSNKSPRNFKTSSVKSSETILGTPSRLQGGKSSIYYDCPTPPEEKISSNSDEDSQIVSYLEEENRDSIDSLENRLGLEKKRSCKCKGNILKRTDVCQCKSNSIDRDYRSKRNSKYFKGEENFWKLKDLEVKHPETPRNQIIFQSDSIESRRHFDDKRKALDWDDPEKKYCSYNSLRHHCDSFTLLCTSRTKKTQHCDDFNQELIIEDPRCIALLIPHGCSLVKNVPHQSCEAQTSDCVQNSSNFMRSRSPTDKSTGTDQIGAICEVLSRSNTSIDSQGRLRSGKSGNIFNIFKRGSSKRRQESQESVEAEERTQSRRSRREKRKRGGKNNKEDSEPKPSSSRPDSTDSWKRTRRERLSKEPICPKTCQEDRTPIKEDKSRSRSQKRRQESYQDLPTKEICPALVKKPAKQAAPHCPETCPRKKGVKQPPAKPTERTTIQQNFIGKSSSGIPLHITVTKSASETESGTTEVKFVTKKLNPPHGPTQQVLFTKKSTHGEAQSCSGPTEKKTVTKKEVTNKTDTGDIKKEVTVVTESITECCADKTEYKYVTKDTSNNSTVTQESSKLCSVIQPNLDVSESNNRFYCPDNCESTKKTRDNSFYQIADTPIFVKVSEQQSADNQNKNPCEAAIQESLLTPSNYNNFKDSSRPKSQSVTRDNEVCKNPTCEENLKGTAKNTNQNQRPIRSSSPRRQTTVTRDNEVCNNPICEENLKGSTPKNTTQNQRPIRSSSPRRQTTNQVFKKDSETCGNPACDGEILRKKLAELLATTEKESEYKYSSRKNTNQVSQKNSRTCANPSGGRFQKDPEICVANQSYKYTPSTSKRGSHQASRKNSEVCINPNCEGSLQESVGENRGAFNQDISEEFLITVAQTYESLKQKQNNNQSRSYRGFQTKNSSKNLVTDDNFVESVSAAYAILNENQPTSNSHSYPASKKPSEISKEFVGDVDFIQSVAATYLVEKQSTDPKSSQGSRLNQKKNSEYPKNLSTDEDFLQSVAHTYAVLNENNSSAIKTTKTNKRTTDFVADEDFLQSVADTYTILNEKNSSDIKSNQKIKTNKRTSEFRTDQDFLHGVDDTYAILNENQNPELKPHGGKGNKSGGKTTAKSGEIDTDEDFLKSVAESFAIIREHQPTGQYKPKPKERAILPKSSSKGGRDEKYSKTQDRPVIINSNNQIKLSAKKSTSFFVIESTSQDLQKRPEFNKNQSCNQKFRQQPRETNKNPVCGKSFQKRPSETGLKPSCNQKYNPKASENQICGANLQKRPSETCQNQSNQKYSKRSSDICRIPVCKEDSSKGSPTTSQKQSFNDIFKSEAFKNKYCAEEYQKRTSETCPNQRYNQKSNQKSSEGYQVCGEDFRKRSPETYKTQSFNQKSSEAYKNQVCGEDYQKKDQAFKYNQNQVCGENFQKRTPDTYHQSLNKNYNQKSGEAYQVCREDSRKRAEQQSSNQRYKQKSGEFCQNPKCGEEILETLVESNPEYPEVISFIQKYSYNSTKNETCPDETCPNKGNTSGRSSPRNSAQQSRFNKENNRFSPAASSTRLERSDSHRSRPERHSGERGSGSSLHRRSPRHTRLNTDSPRDRSPRGSPRGTPIRSSGRSPSSTRRNSTEGFTPKHSSTLIETPSKYCEISADKKFACDCKEYLEKKYGLGGKYGLGDKYGRGEKYDREQGKQKDPDREAKSRKYKGKSLKPRRSDTSAGSGSGRSRGRKSSNRRERVLGVRYTGSTESFGSTASRRSYRRSTRRERVLGDKYSRESLRSRGNSRTSLGSGGRQRKYKEEKSAPVSSESHRRAQRSGRGAKRSDTSINRDSSRVGTKRSNSSVNKSSGRAARRSDTAINRESSRPRTKKSNDSIHKSSGRAANKRSDTSISRHSGRRAGKRSNTTANRPSPTNSICKVCPPEEDTRHRRRIDCLDHRKLTKGKFGYTDSGCSICSAASNCSIGLSSRAHKREPSPRSSPSRKRSDNSINRSRQRRLVQEREIKSSEQGRYTPETFVCPPSCVESLIGVTPKASPTREPRKRSPSSDQDNYINRSRQRKLDQEREIKSSELGRYTFETLCPSSCAESPKRVSPRASSTRSPRKRSPSSNQDNYINRSRQRQLDQEREIKSSELGRYTPETLCPPSCAESPKRVSPRASSTRSPRKRSPSADQAKRRSSASPHGSRTSVCSTTCRDKISPKISSPQLSCRQSDIHLNQTDKYHYRVDPRSEICSPRVCGPPKRSSSPYSSNLDSYLYTDPEKTIRRGRSRKVISPKVAKGRGCAANLGRTDSGLLRRRDSPSSYSSRYNNNRDTPTFPCPSTSRNYSAERTQSKVSPRISSSYYTKGTDSCICPGNSSYKSTVKNTNQSYKKSSQSPIRSRISPCQITRRPSSAITPRRKGESFTTDIFQCSFCPEKYQQSNFNRASNTSVCTNDFNINFRRETSSSKKRSRSKVKPCSPCHSVVYCKNKPGSLHFTLKEIDSTLCPPRTITFKSLTDFNESKEELHTLRESNLHPYPSTCSVACQSRSAENCNTGNLAEKPYKPTWNDLLCYCDSISKSRKKKEGYYRERFCSQPPLSERVRAVIKKLEKTSCSFDSDCESDSSSESCFCGTSEQDLKEFDDDMSDKIVFPRWNTPEPGPGLLRYQNRLSGIICPNEHAPVTCDCVPSRCVCDDVKEDFRPSRSVKLRSKKSHASYGLCPNSTANSCTCSDFVRRERSLERERERVRKERKVSFDKTYNKPICPPERPSSQRLSFLDDPPYCSMSSFLSDVNFQKIKSLYKTSHEPSRPASRK